MCWLGPGCSPAVDGSRPLCRIRPGSGGAGCRRAVGCRRCGGVAVSRPSGSRVQLPAALMDGPVVGSAEQGEVGQVGGAAMEPVAQVVGFAPAQGSGAVGEDTAAVAHGQGGALGGLDDPGGPADFQGLGGGAPRVGGSRGGGPEPGRQPVGPAGVVGFGWWPQRSGRGVRVVPGRWGRGRGGGWPGCWRVTSTRVTAPSQASRRHASGSSGPAQPTSPPTASGWPSRLSRSTITLSCGRTPPVWGSRPPSRWRRANSVRASALRWLPLRVSVASAGRANGSRAASRLWPASGSSNPSTATMPSKVGASHNPRRAWRRSRSRSAPSGSATWSRWPSEPPQPTWVQPSGRLDQHRFGLGGDVVGQVVGAGGQDLGVGDRQLPVAHGLGGFGQRSPEQGPGGPDGPAGRAGRSGAAGCAARPRSSRPAGRLRPRRPRGRRRPASSLSQWPSRRSSSRRSSRTRSARTASGSRSRSRAASRSSDHGQRGQASPGARPVGDRLARSNVCSSPWEQPINPPAQRNHLTQIVDNFLPLTPRRSDHVRHGLERPYTPRAR